jgi:hypothetical protein
MKWHKYHTQESLLNEKGNDLGYVDIEGFRFVGIEKFRKTHKYVATCYFNINTTIHDTVEEAKRALVMRLVSHRQEEIKQLEKLL